MIKKLLVLPLALISAYTFANKIYVKTTEEVVSLHEKPAVKSYENVSNEISSSNLNAEELNDVFKKDQGAEESTSILVKTVSDTIPSPKNKSIEKVKSKHQTSDNLMPPPVPAQNLVVAQFPGGMNELRKLVAQNFDISKMQGEKGTLRSDAYISINKHGKVTNVGVDGESEIFNKVLKETLQKIADVEWKPEIADGEARDTVLRLPVTMNFQ